MKKVIGITGGIASGKSLVSKYLVDKGYVLIDCDKISHEITEPNKEGYQDIVKHFGEQVLNDDKTINRKFLATIIFNDEKERVKLNGLLHPIIKNKVINIIKNSKKEIIFLDVPLLFESDFHYLCDYSIVVYVNFETQLKRLKERDNINDEMANKLIRSQMSLEEKNKRADFIIDNNKSINDTYLQVNKIIKNIKELVRKCQEF